MNKQKILTIGIPTFNRINTVCDNISSLIEEKLHEHEKIHIIIIDNSSSDGTYNQLKNLVENTSVTLLKNETNVGVVNNILKIFEVTQTDYLMLCSDEDHISPCYVDDFICFLEKTKPLFVSTQYIYKNRLYRGRKNTVKINPEEWFKTAFYISGIVYSVKESRKIIANNLEYIQHPHQYYFQNLLVAKLLLTGDCYWYSNTIVKNHIKLNTTINMERKINSYSSIASRWEQYLETDRFLSQLITKCDNQPQRLKAEKMRLAYRRNIIKVFRHSIKTMHPSLVNDFDKSILDSASKIITYKHPFLGKLFSFICKT